MSDFRKKMDMDEVRAFIASSSPQTRVYVGGDSERHKVNGVWYADYTVCVVVHIDGCHGCKVFGQTVRERDYDQKKNAPRMRLMNEVYKIAELFQEIKDSIGDRKFEVHIDVNPDEKYGSSCVLSEAVGYVKAMCNVVPLVKPNSPAATFCADRFSQIKQIESARINRETGKLTASRLKRKRKIA